MKKMGYYKKRGYKVKEEKSKIEQTQFDEDYEVLPEERTSQKEKGRYSPYKSGGGKRSVKK